MYRTMELVQQPKPVHELLQEVVSLLPGAWQYPEITAARLSFDGQEYRTPGYAASEWAQSARFSTRDAKDGSIEVVYLEKRPAEAEGPFLAEERSLIDSLAQILEGFLNRRISEEALRESEERFRTAFEEGSVAMALTALDSTLLKVNSRFCRMLGFSESELVGRSFTEITHPDDRAANLVGTRQLARGEISSFHMEKRYLRKDGTILWGDMNTASVQDANGRPLYCVTHVQDITERKRAEEALRESRRRLERAQEIAHLGSWELDLGSDRLTWSDEVYRIFGLQPQEFGATYEAFLDCVHPEDRAAVDAAYSGSLREGRDTYEIEHRIVRRFTGEIRIVHEKCEHVRGVSGRIVRSIGMVHDITERKRAEEALRELNATLESQVARRTAELQHRARQLQKLALELSEAEERERRRIAVILHEDLQQQIAGAKFHLNLVRSRAKDDRQQTDVDTVDAMLKEAIEKSRTLSRDLSPAVLHMNDLAEVLQWLANRVRAQQGLSVSLNLRGDMMLHSEALATFLFRATQEMLFNVVKHAHVREAAIRVRRVGRYVCLSVSDQGRGFDPQELKETSGMGLFSIRERTGMLGGRMKVTSAKGKGSRFSLMVPDGPKPEDRRQKTEDGRQESKDGLLSSVLRHPSSGPVLRVLLVDDHDVVRAGLAALLREASGIELVGEARDGREAINLANDLQPDVVIMDVSMPLMGGDQATRQIKAHLPQTRVIALSMYDEAEKKQKMFEAGAEGYILKTISAEELLATIRGQSIDGS